MLFVDWPAGAILPPHTHPGDEYAVVLEGELTLTAEGQPDRVIVGGQPYFNPRGLVHGARNSGAGAARSVTILVIDKGAPRTQFVNPPAAPAAPSPAR